MKVAQLLATIPDLIPPEYAAELQKLQSEAPPMGAAFVKRRMQAELGPDWQRGSAPSTCGPPPRPRSGRSTAPSVATGRRSPASCNIPDMQSAVEADLRQLEIALALHRRLDPAIDTREIGVEIGERVREELDYEREAKHARPLCACARRHPEVRVPAVHLDLSTRRLLTLGWLEGEKILTFTAADQEIRNRLAVAMFKAWWHPFSHAAVIHGDPHLGNYTVFSEGGEPQGINLLDYGCIRIFHPRFVGGVVDLYYGLLHDDRDRVVHAYETWGFRRLSAELIDILNIWARFIYGPLLDDRIAHGRRRGEAVRIRPPAGLRGAPGPEGEGPGGRCRGNSCSWTARRSGSVPCSCISGRISTSTVSSRPRSSGSRSRRLADQQRAALDAAGLALPM